MPTPTNSSDTTTRETAEQARATAARSQREFDRAEQVASIAVGNLMRALTDSIRLFIPPVVLQPEAAIRITATALEQVVEIQRRFLEELLTASRDAVVASDIEPMQVEVRSNGRRSVAA